MSLLGKKFPTPIGKFFELTVFAAYATGFKRS